MRWRTLFAAALLAPALSAQAPAGSPAGEWRQFRGTPALSGVSADTPPASLKLLWTHDAGSVVESSAAIAGGSVYVGGGDGDLLALNLADGTLRWKYSTGNLIGESSPAVGADAVYVGDLGGLLHAVRLRDGTRLWTFQAGNEVKSSPVIVGDTVLIGSYDGHLYAVDAATGRQRWKVLTQGQVHATPAVRNGVAYIAGCDAIFRAIRVSDGREMFQIPSGAYTGASPVLDGDRAYFGTFNQEVLALDLAKRRILWRYSDPERQFPYYSSAAVADGKVIVGGRDKMVHALDANTGKEAWRFTTRARVDSSPVIAAGRVYIGSSDNRLYVLDLASGKNRPRGPALVRHEASSRDCFSTVPESAATASRPLAAGIGRTLVALKPRWPPAPSRALVRR
jgi:outer membrane protein assembly factor BamB